MLFCRGIMDHTRYAEFLEKRRVMMAKKIRA